MLFASIFAIFVDFFFPLSAGKLAHAGWQWVVESLKVLDHLETA